MICQRSKREERMKSDDIKFDYDAIVLSLADGVVWASWPGKTDRVKLGDYAGVTYMMRNFLAQCELGERMIRGQAARSPATTLKEQILERRGLRQSELAEAMGVSRVQVHHLVNSKSRINVEMALRLAHATDTNARYWLALQLESDLAKAQERLRPVLTRLPTLR
jgi:addiction module HigA family antidote